MYLIKNNAYPVKTATPSAQGFGENVIITTNITYLNGQNDINTVLVGITPHSGSETNYTMWNISSDIWTLDNFTDYKNGTYTYTTYVNDSQGLWASDSGLSPDDSGQFEMYINLYSNIKTLKDVYYDNESVYITGGD